MWHQAKERQQMELECVPHENCIFSIQAVFASVQLKVIKVKELLDKSVEIFC